MCKGYLDTTSIQPACKMDKTNTSRWSDIKRDLSKLTCYNEKAAHSERPNPTKLEDF